MKVPSEKYEIFDHTADLGIRVLGATRSDLFVNAGMALFDLIGKPSGQTEMFDIPLEVNGEDEAMLLINWLRELLYLFNGRDLMVDRIEILSMKDLMLSARVDVMRVNFEAFDGNYDIKAVTYHQARIRKCGEGYEATVVFDL